MIRFIKENFTIADIVLVIIIIVATIGLMFELIPIQKLTVALLGLLAIQALLERVTFFRGLREQVAAFRMRRCIRSRLGPDFQDFRNYCEGAQEVFVSGLSLGFAVGEQSFVFAERLIHNCEFKVLVVDPELPDETFSLLVEHDERSGDPEFAQSLKFEINTSIRTLENFRTLPHLTGHLEARFARGLPTATITMVNPKQNNGKMRVEFRPYKGSQGARPYFELKKSEEEDQFWYEYFFQRYYKALWEDSKPVVEF
jgi:hypothetical protein